jgi:MYXO-CTERM domain-containing protein
MQKSSLIKFISAGILATSVLVIPITSPASAQTSGTGTNGTNGTTGTTGTTTTTNYDNNKYDPGLWGLTGLLGLFGLLGRRKEETHTTTRRDDAPAYRDPTIR